MLKTYKIGGMSCAACSSRVEKAVSKISGVETCTVSLLLNKMVVETTEDDSVIIAAVENAGYTAEVDSDDQKAKLESKQKNSVLKGFIVSLVLLFALMYVSMFHTMWNFPLPDFLTHNPIVIGTVQAVLSLTIIIINRHFFINGFLSVKNGAPNMDTLVALGSGASYIYSIVRLFQMFFKGASHEILHDLYFESAAMILVLITLGKFLELRAKGKTTNAIKSLLDLKPKTATLLRDNVQVTVPIEEVKIGDIFLVRPGELVATDGIIIEGGTSLDEAAITGESTPQEKLVGDSVYSAASNLFGFIKCRATADGTNNTISKIIKMVEGAANTKAPIQRIADKVSGVFVPVVILIAVVTTVLWLIFFGEAGFALARGISVLVISCPCALGLATPVAIMVASGVGARGGVLFKSAVSLETLGKVKNIALDKTGTITLGLPSVRGVYPNADITENELIENAYLLELRSEHPLSKAIINEAKLRGINTDFSPSDLKVLVGEGLMCTAPHGEMLLGGNAKFIEKHLEIPKHLKDTELQVSENGETPLYFSKGEKLLGIISVADTIKEDSISAIAELKKLGINTVMLTGDNRKTADAIARISGVDSVIAQVMPDKKREVVEGLKLNGKTAMVGDGINDAPALAAADVGIAIGAGTDIAIDSSDVVLIKSRLMDLVYAVKLARKTLKNIHENLFWAFIYNIIGIPIAAGLLINPLGLTLNPMLAAAMMSLSSVCVVTNALRLNLFKTKMKGSKKMNKTIKIEGMMCPHCENHVKTKLETIPGVSDVQVSHKDGTAKVKVAEEVNDEILMAAVETEGYKVLGVE